MSQYNTKGMASDLSLGRPSTSHGSDTNLPAAAAAAAAAARHAYLYMQHASRGQQNYRDDAQYESNMIHGLECHVRALQGEREKLDAFRRELPICMSLLDDAILASREKLTKAVASSRTVACEASYSNYGNSAAYAANNIIWSKGGGVQSTSASRELEEASMNNMYAWGVGGSKAHAHAHASHDDEHQFEKQQPPPLSNCLPPHNFATTSPLHLINYPPPAPTSSNNLFLNKLQQKEGRLFNEDNEMMRVLQSRKAEGFQNTIEFSSSKTNEEEQIMRAREGKQYVEGVADEKHMQVRDEEEASPTLMISNMPNNGNVSMSGAGGMMPCQTPRKARRCWSPELHQRFLHALHQLGGPQSATPKQIREVMHVEGLTNDEVKSHLQKFRLHTRRPAPIQASEPAQQPHHLVLFGGIWVPTSPAESAPAAQLASCGQLSGGGHATSSGNHSGYVPFQHVIGHNPMQALMRAASSEQTDMQHAGFETASEVDVARSDQSTSQNGGLENNVHEDEDTEIHLGSKPIICREITSPIAKARYQ